MLSVLLFSAIALAGAGMVIGYAVWLAHKGADIAAEVAVLARQAAQLGELLGQISPSHTPDVPTRLRN